jgi:hypothetical protein
LTKASIINQTLTAVLHLRLGLFEPRMDGLHATIRAGEWSDSCFHPLTRWEARNEIVQFLD